MIRTALNFIAGVDRKTLETCPATDKMWAAHLGFSLCLSFVVVLGISFHATGYMIADVWTRLLAALVIALTVLMFDRALCQSDWFYQGTLWTKGDGAEAESRQSTWRFGRIAIRLAMSFGLAWVIAMFLELAIFSGTIDDKIERDRVAANQPIYQKIEQFNQQLGGEIDRRQAAIVAMEGLLHNALNEVPAADAAAQGRSSDIEQQIKALAARESELRAEQREIQQTVQRYAADMNAEELGQKLTPTNSGRPGAGPRYEFAKRQKELYQGQIAARDGEIAQLHAKTDELRAAQITVAADSLAARNVERAALEGKRSALQAQIDAARAELKQLEAERVANVEQFRRKALAESYFQEKKDKVDPLTRMAAYQELKNDPKDGGTMALFSWMTRFFIIFLEIVPVVAKIFFSPPSVYAAKIQDEVERARRRIQNAADEPLPEPEPQLAPRIEPGVAKRLFESIFGKAEAPKPQRRDRVTHVPVRDRAARSPLPRLVPLDPAPRPSERPARTSAAAALSSLPAAPAAPIRIEKLTEVPPGALRVEPAMEELPAAIVKRVTEALPAADAASLEVAQHGSPQQEAVPPEVAQPEAPPLRVTRHHVTRHHAAAVAIAADDVLSSDDGHPPAQAGISPAAASLNDSARIAWPPTERPRSAAPSGDLFDNLDRQDMALRPATARPPSSHDGAGAQRNGYVPLQYSLQYELQQRS
ncbi:putative nucleic acid-binding Zn-ribbon protein [Rhodopseudomonas rhenobacensis]|uniref:Putative nucleic acid-binding Zn-ribbon protein n=1 Tax=Rhodopseudomonas rhenobacensis TaxID=87461 RepID=A0A7W7Z590_9BRAD|nr:DUF4407 domain-containing protein [Rhodopseudomonas rhenobacensis]MBB5048103.1 putative nucleic acid-binding Zn-ribbon protein [Rhodopseudomonas rhenobacensis]